MVRPYQVLLPYKLIQRAGDAYAPLEGRTGSAAPPKRDQKETAGDLPSASSLARVCCARQLAPDRQQRAHDGVAHQIVAVTEQVEGYRAPLEQHAAQAAGGDKAQTQQRAGERPADDGVHTGTADNQR